MKSITGSLSLALVLLTVLFSSGCADVGYTLSRLHGFECRPEKLVNGQCVALTDKGK